MLPFSMQRLQQGDAVVSILTITNSDCCASLIAGVDASVGKLRPQNVGGFSDAHEWSDALNIHSMQAESAV